MPKLFVDCCLNCVVTLIWAIKTFIILPSFSFAIINCWTIRVALRATIEKLNWVKLDWIVKWRSVRLYRDTLFCLNNTTLQFKLNIVKSDILTLFPLGKHMSHHLSSGVHAFGLCATALITDVLQLMTGYPTPYFLTVCKPNYTTLNVSCEQNPYIMEDICSGSDPAAINQGR